MKKLAFHQVIRKTAIMKDKIKNGNTPQQDPDEYGRMLDRLVEESRKELSKKLGFEIPAIKEDEEAETEDYGRKHATMQLIKPDENERVAADHGEETVQTENINDSHKSILTRRRKFIKTFIASAAAVLLCVVCFNYILSFAEQARRQASAGTVAFCERDSTFRLSDGSEITLQASTELTVDKSFGKKDRVVALSGMGYMHAATDSLRPYTVNMPHGLSLTVRGTSFNINAYPGNSRTEITVTSGCVAVRNTKSGEIYGEFRKGDRFIYDAATGKARRQSGVNLTEATAWMQGGRIVLHHATRDEFKDIIFRRFGKEVVIKDNAIPRDADIMWESADLHPDVEDVAGGVGFLYGCRTEISDNKVIIRPEV